MRGGPRANAGPAPDPDALRRDRKDDAAWLTLPLAGRSGPPPKWPLAAPSKRELELWKSEWSRPQAVMWERNGQEVEVALYVRSVVKAESDGAPVAARVLVVRQQEVLGISLTGLARNRWRIESRADKTKTTRTGARATPARASAKNRLRVVSGGKKGNGEG
ncbi:MAG: hypothetical protein JWP11_1914 [Frankiales bacterium]|nr:hypothetical protein [Frankiales bacterium]